jgi:predicted Zn-dependent peptidase
VGPAIEYFGETLGNGLRVAGACLPWLRTGAAVLSYRVGWRDERADEAGLTHLVEHLCFRGANDALSRELSRDGLYVNGRTDCEDVHFIAAGHDALLPRGLELLANTFRELPDDPATLAQELEIHKHELAGHGMGPADLEMNKVTAQLIGDQTFGRPPWEQARILAKLGLPRVRAHHAAWFHPANAQLTLVSREAPSETLPRIRERFGGPKRDVPPRPTPSPPAGRPAPLVVRRYPGGYSLAMLWYRLTAPSAPLPALRILQDLLGGQPHGAMFQELRQRGRMGYEFGSGLTLLRDCSILTVHGVVQRSSLLPALTFMLDQLDGLRADGVGEADFDQTRRRLLYSLDAVEDDPSELCRFLAESAPGPDGAVRTPEKLRSELSALTRESFNAAIADVLAPERRTAVLFGSVGWLQSWKAGRLLRRRAAPGG